MRRRTGWVEGNQSDKGNRGGWRVIRVIRGTGWVEGNQSE